MPFVEEMLAAQTDAVNAFFADWAGLPPSPYAAAYVLAVLLVVEVHIIFVLLAYICGQTKLLALTDEETNPPLPQQQTTAEDGRPTR